MLGSSVATPAQDVLLVEDDSDSARLVTRWLEHTGRIKVTVAVTGAAGAALIEQRPWAAVITDLELPEVHGLDLLRRVRATRRATPVMVITAHASFDSAQQALWQRADDYLSKPLEHSTFTARVTSLLRSAESRAGEARASASRLRRARRVEAFASGMCHELNSRLTPVIGFADLLLLELGGAQSSPRLSREYCQAVVDGSQSVLESVRRLRWLSRPQKTGLRSVDLVEVVRDALGLVRFRLDHSQMALTVTLPERDVPVFVDPGVIEGIVLDLALDAVEAAARSGVTSLEFGVDVDESRASVTLRCESGAGPQNDRVQLMTDADSLKYYADVVGEFGGTIDVDLQWPATTVRVGLPRAETAHVPGPDPRAGSPRRALVVDDDPLMREVAAEMLASVVDCVVDRADGVDAAMALLDRQAYVLVLSDLHMGTATGVDLWAHVASAHPQLASTFVLMSGDPGDGSGLPPVPVIKKPFSMKTLIETCAAALPSTPTTSASVPVHRGVM